MSSFRTNILANFSGQVWSACLNLALVPIYISYLGVDAYGLIGFFVSLQAMIVIFDLGLSTTTNREIARRSENLDSQINIRNLIKTLEVVYLIVGGIIALILFLSSSWIANHWITSKTLSPETIGSAFIIFGLIIAFRWPISLYSGALRGLEKQLLLNWLSVFILTLKGLGSVIILTLISPKIILFLFWQLLVGILEVLLLRAVAWKNLPLSTQKAKFDFQILKGISRLSAELSLISIFAVTLKQLDKVLISKLMTIDQLGYYSTAVTATMGLYLFCTPVFQAAFPRFSSLFSKNDTDSLAETFHYSAKLISFVVVPFACLMIFFPHEFLLFWTRSEDVASKAQIALSILALASMINIMMQIPYALQLASGLTWISLWNNGLSVLFITPAIYFLVKEFGIIGGAIAWLTFNIIYFLLIPTILHRNVLPNEKQRWLFKDTLPFMMTGLIVFGIAKIMSHYINFHFSLILIIFLAFSLYLILNNKFFIQIFPLKILGLKQQVN